MVGRRVSCILGRTCEVVAPGRDEIDAGRSGEEALTPMLAGADYVVNCVGVFDAGAIEMLRVNSVFPLELQAACRRGGCRMIQVSTDGVFKSCPEKRVESDYSDAEDMYGISKRLGEPSGAMSLRTSLVGLGGGHSLFDNVRLATHFTGFRNHVWNGMTALEFAKCCGKIILGGLFEEGIFHLFSETVTKEQLVRMFVGEAGLETIVSGEDASLAVHRELSSIWPLNSALEVRGLRQQMSEMMEMP